MALESVTHIGDLDSANPTSSDPKSDGDNHIRNLKTAMLNSFAGFEGAVMVTGTDGGAFNALTLTPAPALSAYGERMVALFAPTVANTGPATLNISGLGAKAIKAVDGSALVAGDLAIGTIYAATYTGTEFRLLSITKNYADQLALATALPAQSLGFARSDGTATAFTQSHTGYAQNEVRGADIASAATINLTTATGNFVHVTGTTTITAITIPVGAERTVIFDGVLTLTHGAALLLPGAANIVTAANDRMTVRGDTAGAIVVSYDRANGAPVGAIPFLHVREESAGQGGSSISGTQDRTLNTVVTNSIPGASLASNTITLPAGTYDFTASAPAQDVSRHRVSLYNDTDAATLAYGTSAQTSGTDFDVTHSTVSGRFTLSATKNLKVQHYTAGAVATSGLGVATSDGLPAVYATAQFWKVA